MADRTPIPPGAYQQLMRKILSDEQRRAFLEQMQTARNAEDQRAYRAEAGQRPSVSAQGASRRVNPELISNALLAGTLGGAMSFAGLPSVPFRAGLVGGSLPDAVLNAGTPEDAAIPAALAGAGALGKLTFPAMAALGAAYSPDTEAGGIQKLMQMFYHGSNAPLERGTIRGALDVSPQRRVAQYFADKRTDQLGGEPRVYSVLADPFAGEKHGLALPFDRINESTPNFTQARRLREQDRPIRITTDNGVEEFAEGGRATRKPVSPLKLFKDRQLEESSRSVTSPIAEGNTKLDELYDAAMTAGNFYGLGVPAMAKAALAKLGPLAMAGVIKQKGGNWLTGSVEDAVRGLKRQGHNGEAPIPGTKSDALNSFIDKQLTRYIKNEMATPEDPIRALAERGVLHVDPEALRNGLRLTLLSGDVPEKLGKSVAAQRWENTTDRIPRQASYLDHLTMDVDYTRQKLARKLEEAGGKFALDNPDALAYGFNRGTSTRDLGFDHLIDELSNALNPESGLPRTLQLAPDKLNKVSVPQAVELVSKINAHRAAQKAEADAMRANNSATVVHKEYPENNPLGLRWVELKHNSEVPLPEGFSLDKSGRVLDKYGNYIQDPRKQALQDALKYEGDTMGHCVGGYCGDVLSGRSRIYSLRDAKGQPYVTVEVVPGKKLTEADLPDSVRDRLADFDGSQEEFEALVQKSLADQAIGDRIIQIKGPQNRAPNAEYLPFVQDFVKSGKWSDVGDLQNTGLRSSRDIWNDLEQQKIREAGHDFGAYVSPEEKGAICKAVWGDAWGKYAHGGSVAPPDKFQAIIAALEQELTHA